MLISLIIAFSSYNYQIHRIYTIFRVFWSFSEAYLVKISDFSTR